MEVTTRNQTYNSTVVLVTAQCCNCNMLFAAPQDFVNRRREDHATFYCPHGHGQSYRGKSEAERLKEEKLLVEQELSRTKERATHFQGKYESTERSLHTMKGHVTRKRKQLDRVKSGVCPCCNRSFQNVKAHMEDKHPTFQKDE